MRKFALAAVFLLSAGLAGAQQVKLLEDIPAPAAQPGSPDEMPQVIMPSEESPAPAAKPAVKQAVKKAAAKKSAKAAAPATKPAAVQPAAKAQEAVVPAKTEAKPAEAAVKQAATPEVKPVPATMAAKPETKPAPAKMEVKPAAPKAEVKPAPAAAPAKTEIKAAAPKTAVKPVAVPVAAKPEIKPAATPAAPQAAPRQEPGAGFSVQKTHAVTSGDTLWDLSNKYYKDPFKWGKIYNANLNRVNDPDLIYPKNELLIPDLTEEVKPEVKPEPGPAAVIAVDDTVKEPELQASEVAQPEEPAVFLPPPGKPAAAELKEALSAYDRMDLSEKMPSHQKEWGSGVRIVPDGWQEDGVITAKESADDDSMEDSLSLDGAVLKIRMARAGAKRGDYLTVYMIGSEAFDKNGKRLGRELQRVGMAEVLEADGSMVKARVIDAVTGIVKGYVVKKK